MNPFQKQTYQNMKNDIIEGGNIYEMAHLKQNGAKNTNSYLNTDSSTGISPLTDEQFRIANCLRTFKNPYHNQQLNDTCSHCQANINKETGGNPLHFMSCFHTKGERTRRHCAIVRMIYKKMRQLDTHVEYESDIFDLRRNPTQSNNQSKVRPDLVSTIEDGWAIYDIAIVEPTSTTYVNNASQTPLHTAKLAYERKKRWYNQVTNMPNATKIIPWILESTGGLYTKSRNFIRKYLMNLAITDEPRQWYKDLIYDINNKLVIMNSIIARKYLQYIIL